VHSHHPTRRVGAHLASVARLAVCCTEAGGTCYSCSPCLSLSPSLPVSVQGCQSSASSASVEKARPASCRLQGMLLTRLLCPATGLVAMRPVSGTQAWMARVVEEENTRGEAHTADVVVEEIACPTNLDARFMLSCTARVPGALAGGAFDCVSCRCCPPRSVDFLAMVRVPVPHAPFRPCISSSRSIRLQGHSVFSAFMSAEIHARVPVEASRIGGDEGQSQACKCLQHRRCAVPGCACTACRAMLGNMGSVVLWWRVCKHAAPRASRGASCVCASASANVSA
jgi:hypothetical protein